MLLNGQSSNGGVALCFCGAQGLRAVPQSHAPGPCRHAPGAVLSLLLAGVLLNGPCRHAPGAVLLCFRKKQTNIDFTKFSTVHVETALVLRYFDGKKCVK